MIALSLSVRRTCWWNGARPDALRKLYPRFDDFVRVLEDVDPHGMFRNPYVQRHIFGKQGGEYADRVYKAIQ